MQLNNPYMEQNLKVSYHKKVTFLIYAMPLMLVMMVIVMYQDSKIRNAQIKNSGIALSQRDKTLQLLLHMDGHLTNLDKRLDTVITKEDTVLLLYKPKKIK